MVRTLGPILGSDAILLLYEVLGKMDSKLHRREFCVGKSVEHSVHNIIDIIEKILAQGAIVLDNL